MAFVAVPNSGSQPETPETEAIIHNDGFFPDIDPVSMREAVRLPKTVTAARLRAAILGAIMTVENDLRAFAETCRAAGYQSLAVVPAPQLDGQSIQLIRYQRAVALFAKAEVTERYRDFDTTAAGGKQIDELDQSVDELRRDALHAIRDILGKSRTAVYLI